MTPGRLKNLSRTAQGEWVLDHFSARQLLNLAQERLHIKEVERQTLVNDAIREAGIYKVPEKTTNKHHNNKQYIKIFNINRNFKVQHKLCAFTAMGL